MVFVYKFRFQNQIKGLSRSYLPKFVIFIFKKNFMFITEWSQESRSEKGEDIKSR